LRPIWLIGAVVLVAACSTVLANNARQQLNKQCEEKGLQFVEKERTTREGLVIASASVSGECVGPGDPRYVQPMPQASK